MPVPNMTQNLLDVSMTPAQRWLNRSPSSCGNVSKKCRDSRSNVSNRCSSRGDTPFRKW
jgi:hypothetical protein